VLTQHEKDSVRCDRYGRRTTDYVLTLKARCDKAVVWPWAATTSRMTFPWACHPTARAEKLKPKKGTAFSELFARRNDLLKDDSALQEKRSSAKR